MDIEKISQGAEKIQSNLLTNHPDLDSQVQQNFKNIIQTLRCIGDNNPLVREKKEIEFSNHLKDYQNLKGRIDEVTRKEFIRLMNDFMGELYKSVRWQDVYSFLFAVQVEPNFTQTYIFQPIQLSLWQLLEQQKKHNSSVFFFSVKLSSIPSDRPVSDKKKNDKY